MHRRLFLAAGAATLSGAAPTPASAALNLTPVAVAEGLSYPWSFGFLPDRSLLVTEKTGTLRHVTPQGVVSEPLTGLPPIQVQGQGGLLDLLLDPGFTRTRRLWLSFARQVASGQFMTSILTATLAADARSLNDVQVIFTGSGADGSGQHFGGRLAMSRFGLLFLSIGDRGNRNRSQDPKDHAGKILRLTKQGRAAAGNPFANGKDGLPAIFSLGHRNPQGLCFDPVTDELLSVEHGPQGGDELNRIRVRRNYGWPLVTRGEEYGGGTIGQPSLAGYVDPLLVWTPSIAPSGLTVLTSSRYPGWRGSIFFGALAGRHLRRIDRRGNGRIRGQEVLLADLGERIRDVRQGPDGLLYVLTDSAEGRVLRLDPG